MAKRITGDVTVSVTTTAQDVDIRFRDFLLVNNSEAPVFFREGKGRQGSDGTDRLRPAAQEPASPRHHR